MVSEREQIENSIRLHMSIIAMINTSNAYTDDEKIRDVNEHIEAIKECELMLANLTDNVNSHTFDDSTRLSRFKRNDIVFRSYDNKKYLITDDSKAIWELVEEESQNISEWNATNNGGFVLVGHWQPPQEPVKQKLPEQLSLF